MLQNGFKYLIKSTFKSKQQLLICNKHLLIKCFSTSQYLKSYSDRDYFYAKKLYQKVKQGKPIEIMNIDDIKILQEAQYVDEDFDFNLEIDQIIEVLEQKRSSQYDLKRETKVLYEVMSEIKDHKMVYTLITEFVPYFTQYFKDINKNFKDLEDGQTFTKALLLAHILFYRVQADKYQVLYNELQKVIFRSQRMLLSRTSHYHALIYKQQLELAKNESNNQVKTEDGSMTLEVHPLKTIGKFLMQSMWFNQDNQLGEDTWPQEIQFEFDDITRLFETLTYQYDQTLLEVITDLFMQNQEQKIMQQNPEQVKFSQLLELLSIMSDLVFEGISHKYIKQTLQYLINQLLIQMHDNQEFSLIIKSMSILNNTLIARTVDNPLLLKLVVDSIVFHFKNKINTNFKPNDIEKNDILRLLQYCEDYDQLVEQVMKKMKEHKYLSQDMDIALYAKIGHDITLDFKMEDSTLNSKVKRMIIRNQGVKSFLESDSILQFMRDLKNSEYSIIDQLKRQAFKKPKDKPIDFQKINKPKIVTDNDQWLIHDMDECLETFCLILYSCATIDPQDIMSDNKVLLNIHLIYDILNIIIHKIDPWFIEQIILKFHEQNLLKERLGATGETLYDLTEEFIIINWSLFSDYFRHLYRHTIYED